MKDAYLVSTRHMCVSRDLPEPHGSMRNLDARTTARTPPSSGASLCSTDVETRMHAPFGNCVRYDLVTQKQRFTQYSTTVFCSHLMPAFKTCIEYMKSSDAIQFYLWYYQTLQANICRYQPIKFCCRWH